MEREEVDKMIKEARKQVIWDPARSIRKKASSRSFKVNQLELLTKLAPFEFFNE